MRCCSAQIESCWEKPEKTLKKIEPFIRSAASEGAGMIAFPEQFATGWDPCSEKYMQDSSGMVVSALRKYAREYSITILGSFRQYNQPLPKNTAVVIDGDGSILSLYAKMHPFTPANEERCYAAGNEIAVFKTEGMNFGIAICYDLRFASLFQIYARKGVHGVFVPSAWPESRIRHWQLFIMARAVENQMYIIGINTVGKTPVDDYSGASMTADPAGCIIAQAGDGEEIIMSDLDQETVDDARLKFPVQKDQRVDLYRRLYGDM
jgi:predicted amidohydrolase